MYTYVVIKISEAAPLLGSRLFICHYMHLCVFTSDKYKLSELNGGMLFL